ncbi:MAG: HAD hydrolase family protein [Firmicutes bacterium]|jgi:hydroxymethylpyrimidine pyrophosphatase-like HAD family hydrolase|nr:HAD hydrolase family protein [Bacillota bacterium]
MKKAIILDVDGVIIGEKKGVNTPHPHTDVMAKMKEVRASGVPVVLCTAKPAFAIEYEIKEACLDNPHIADGGGLLVDNTGKVYEKYTLETGLAKEVIQTLFSKKVYTEVYTADDYIIQADQEGDITDKHAFVLQRRPQVVESLLDFCDTHEISKIMQVVADESWKPFGDEVFSPFKERSTMVWAVHPPILPLQFGIITALGISKPQGVINIAKILDIPLENILAVGDSTSDWKFMSLCGFAGVMENGTNELKELAKSKGEGQYIIGGHVDKNGILGILDWYMNL